MTDIEVVLFVCQWELGTVINLNGQHISHTLTFVLIIIATFDSRNANEAF